MSTPENNFREAINRLITLKVHREKMHNMYRGGTFDQWYSGVAGDLWVEYKWIPKIPKKGIVIPKLSSLQFMWGSDRLNEGRKVFVIVGCPEGGVEYPHIGFWRSGLSIEVFRTLLSSKQELADRITERAHGGLDGDFKPAGKNRNRNARRVSNSNSGSTDLGTNKVPKKSRKVYYNEPGFGFG